MWGSRGNAYPVFQIENVPEGTPADLDPSRAPIINLDQAVYVLSTGLDFVGIDDTQHGKRVAYMALCTARDLPLDAAARRDIFHGALLHDIGVSSTEVHHNLVTELAWERVDEHCASGAELLARFRPLAHLAEVVRWHHTHWDQMTHVPISPRDALLANLIFLCDRVDALRAQHLMAGAADPVRPVRQAIEHFRGTLFRPDLVDAFMAVSEGAEFWQLLAPEPLEAWFAAKRPPDPASAIAGAELRDLASLFAHVVDAKSPYTARHSEGVAQLSCLLATWMGLPAREVQLIEVAGLLHDLGKLRVPDAILEKRSPLDAGEMATMRQHARDSYELLQRIDGFHQVAVWAGLHHETPGGDGYPESFRSEALPLPARIISAADVFQALAQDRPYRRGMPPAQVLAVMQREVASNHLDGQVVALITTHLERCWQAALGRQGACSAS
jgi:putative nucleotidyltransferase with HDIG domain